MRLAKSTWVIILAWVVFVGGFAVGSLVIPPGGARTAFGDIALCVVPLFANACLLWNASSAYRRQNNFWMLLAFGCTLWLAGRLIATYQGLVLHASSRGLSAVDIIFFLHTVPLMAALALLPHARKMRETLRYGYLDMLLLAAWWTFLYLFMAVAWSQDPAHTGLDRMRDLQIYGLANLVFLAGTGILTIRAKQGWRKVYANLFGATATYVLGIVVVVILATRGKVDLGGLVTLPIIAAFVWLGTAGIVAHRIAPAPET